MLKKLSLLMVMLSLLTTFTANASWTAYEYRIKGGEYRYGIRQGSEKIPLGNKSRKKAKKAAKKLNKAIAKDSDGVVHDEACDLPGVVC